MDNSSLNAVSVKPRTPQFGPVFPQAADERLSGMWIHEAEDKCQTRTLW